MDTSFLIFLNFVLVHHISIHLSKKIMTCSDLIYVNLGEKTIFVGFEKLKQLQCIYLKKFFSQEVLKSVTPQ